MKAEGRCAWPSASAAAKSSSNCYGPGAGIELPFGGTGKSGHGREKGFAALGEFGITETIVMKHG